MNDQMTVECPHCGERFDTHTMGDLCGCESCGETFRRFTNEEIDADDDLEPAVGYRTIRANLRMWGIPEMEDHLDLEGEEFDVVDATIEGEPGSERIEIQILATIEDGDSR